MGVSPFSVGAIGAVGIGDADVLAVVVVVVVVGDGAWLLPFAHPALMAPTATRAAYLRQLRIAGVRFLHVAVGFH